VGPKKLMRTGSAKLED